MSVAVEKTPSKVRVFGVDLARGIALVAMITSHCFDPLSGDGRPTLTVMTVMGRSATLFVTVAGISLAFLTGGRRPVRGDARRAASTGILVRALLIGVIGLVLGHFAGDLDVILPYYGLFFLLAIPFTGLRPRSLAGLVAALTVIGPLVLLASFALDLESEIDGNPAFTDLITDPAGLLLDFLVTGTYPAVTYLAYLCAGLAIGRLDLSSTRVAARLLGGGLALAVTAWFTSSLLLFRLGGLQNLQDAASGETDPARARNVILWDPAPADSWWWLALRGHHSGTPFDMLHTLGVAMAVLGAALLVTRYPTVRRLLWPVGVAGTMTLTIYSAHAVTLNLNLHDTSDVTFYLVQVVAAVLFAVVWHRYRGQGPLEQLVAKVSGQARRRTAERLAQRSAQSQGRSVKASSDL